VIIIVLGTISHHTSAAVTVTSNVAPFGHHLIVLALAVPDTFDLELHPGVVSGSGVAANTVVGMRPDPLAEVVEVGTASFENYASFTALVNHETLPLSDSVSVTPPSVMLICAVLLQRAIPERKMPAASIDDCEGTGSLMSLVSIRTTRYITVISSGIALLAVHRSQLNVHSTA